MALLSEKGRKKELKDGSEEKLTLGFLGISSDNFLSSKIEKNGQGMHVTLPEGLGVQNANMRLDL